ncbi:glycoside hydrolase family 15 protein [Agaribacterium sp. ZY112]|uniref:glycoside hydrolase family 15 protein n=1 Tax=Agaribacterium sp. ZY112 TaxID=3233574 RepID=UPI003524F4AB
MNAQERLNQLYSEIKKVILSRQHPVTGLLPASTAVNAHGNYTDAWVRDNVYSILAPWALSVAFRRKGDKERQDELEQATIKLMRGLLQSMMRQADKVETFKHSLNPLDALHAKYDTSSGLCVVADDAWGHLQIDATSIFLLIMAQMTASGLRIVRTHDEVDFVQNLIYYISSAYRSPDYGIWERGNKINNGKTEINASSLGMAKAALQALDGLNLFGKGASARAVVHTVADSISLARNSLAQLLPRESLSKEVDSALLSVIGFPAFAVGDPELVTKTRDEILKKLGGRYGCKRFLWDGHQTAIEDPNRLYYEHSELADFEHVESEWPLFFCYLYINALFAGNKATAKFYRHKIESVMIEKEGTKLIPELYYLLEENIEAEKLDPGSQERVANENLPLVWAQSIYYTGLLLDEELIEYDDLDAIRLRGSTTRFNHSQVALVVLAENDEVKQALAEHGVIAESIDDISPIRVISAPHLVDAYSQVGANEALGLTGRPLRRLQSLATSQTYSINNQKCLCLSWLQSENGDYRMRDAQLVCDKLEKEIAHIRKHWVNSEAAVFTLMMTEELCQSSNVSALYKTLKNLQLRTQHTNVGYASASLAYRASRENQLYAPNICINPIRTRTESIPNISTGPKAVYEILSTEDKQQAYAALLDFAESKDLNEDDKQQWLNYIYAQSQYKNNWLLARLSFTLLNKQHSDLSDYLTVLAARHFSVIIGSTSQGEFGLNPTMSADEIVGCLSDVSNSAIELCLLQEAFAAIGTLQRTKPRLFTGLRSIHLQHLLKFCSAKSSDEWTLSSAVELGAQAPSQLFNRIEQILESQRSVYKAGLKSDIPNTSSNSENAAVDTDWFEWRVERGLIVNLDRAFLEAIWQSMGHTRSMSFAEANNKEHIIDCDLVRSSMTSGEEIFAKLIDDNIQQLHPHYYKSAMIEALLAFTRFCEKHPEAQFELGINLGEELEKAAHAFCSIERQRSPVSRDVDILLQETPEVLQYYLEKTYKKTLGLE